VQNIVTSIKITDYVPSKRTQLLLSDFIFATAMFKFEPFRCLMTNDRHSQQGRPTGWMEEVGTKRGKGRSLANLNSTSGERVIINFCILYVPHSCSANISMGQDIVN
jgi:hypothetical protein